MRSLNMQALTRNLQARYPGITVYGIGDAAHQAEASDHNEDDTPGVRTEQVDGDDVPEHRAIDAMLGDSFTHAEADALVYRCVQDAATRARLYYIIWNRSIWSSSRDWQRRDYTGTNPHTDHVHFDGLASDDENSADWPVVSATSAPTSPPAPAPSTMLQKGSTGPAVSHLQQFLRNTFPAYRNSVTYKWGQLISVDGVFGDQTDAWVKEFQRRTGLYKDGIVGPNTFAMLRKYGYQY